jgi:hypothetical protein
LIWTDADAVAAFAESTSQQIMRKRHNGVGGGVGGSVGGSSVARTPILVVLPVPSFSHTNMRTEISVSASSKNDNDHSQLN